MIQFQSPTSTTYTITNTTLTESYIHPSVGLLWERDMIGKSEAITFGMTFRQRFAFWFSAVESATDRETVRRIRTEVLGEYRYAKGNADYERMSALTGLLELIATQLKAL